MSVPEEVLRAALEEYIAPGPPSRRPAAERLRERRPHDSAETLEAALAVAREAVGVAEKLAREYVDGRRSQASIEQELERRFPWLCAEPAPRSAWRRFFFPRRTDLVSRLGHFGYYLAIM